MGYDGPESGERLAGVADVSGLQVFDLFLRELDVGRSEGRLCRVSWGFGGVLGVVEEDVGRSAGTQECAVYVRKDGDFGDSTGDVSPRVDEVEGTEAVSSRVVDCSTQADSAALEECNLCNGRKCKVSI